MVGATKKLFKSIPLYILVFSILYLVVKGIKNDIVFSMYNYLAILSTIIAIILFFFKRNWYVNYITLILVLGSFNLLHFTYETIIFSLSLNISFLNIETIDIQFFSLLLLFIHIAVNNNELKKYISGNSTDY